MLGSRRESGRPRKKREDDMFVSDAELSEQDQEDLVDSEAEEEWKVGQEVGEEEEDILMVEDQEEVDMKVMSGEGVHVEAEVKFQCAHCDFTSQSRNHMSDHELKHTNKPYMCNNCGKDFIRKKCYEKHVCKPTTPHPYPSWSCPACRLAFPDQGSLATHYQGSGGCRQRMRELRASGQLELHTGGVAIGGGGYQGGTRRSVKEGRSRSLAVRRSGKEQEDRGLEKLDELVCELCDYSTDIKHLYLQHLKTRRHRELEEVVDVVVKDGEVVVLEIDVGTTRDSAQEQEAVVGEEPGIVTEEIEVIMKKQDIAVKSRDAMNNDQEVGGKRKDDDQEVKEVEQKVMKRELRKKNFNDNEFVQNFMRREVVAVEVRAKVNEVEVSGAEEVPRSSRSKASSSGNSTSRSGRRLVPKRFHDDIPPGPSPRARTAAPAPLKRSRTLSKKQEAMRGVGVQCSFCPAFLPSHPAHFSHLTSHVPWCK